MSSVDVDTHTHPNWAVHPISGDHYTAYNKPASIIHWLDHARPTAEYVVILDADMVVRSPMTVELLGASRGRPISALYSYLVGIFPDHYMKVKERVPNVQNAQQVGGFSVMHIEDLRRVAPLWLKWTEEVRNDPESWGNTGDIFNQNGKAGPPWISEARAPAARRTAPQPPARLSRGADVRLRVRRRRGGPKLHGQRQGARPRRIVCLCVAPLAFTMDG